MEKARETYSESDTKSRIYEYNQKLREKRRVIKLFSQRMANESQHAVLIKEELLN